MSEPNFRAEAAAVRDVSPLAVQIEENVWRQLFQVFAQLCHSALSKNVRLAGEHEYKRLPGLCAGVRHRTGSEPRRED